MGKGRGQKQESPPPPPTETTKIKIWQYQTLQVVCLLMSQLVVTLCDWCVVMFNTTCRVTLSRNRWIDKCYFETRSSEIDLIPSFFVIYLRSEVHRPFLHVQIPPSTPLTRSAYQRPYISFSKHHCMFYYTIFSIPNPAPSIPALSALTCNLWCSGENLR